MLCGIYKAGDSFFLNYVLFLSWFEMGPSSHITREKSLKAYKGMHLLSITFHYPQLLALKMLRLQN